MSMPFEPTSHCWVRDVDQWEQERIVCHFITCDATIINRVHGQREVTCNLLRKDMCLCVYGCVCVCVCVCLTHTDSEGLDSAVQQLNQAEQVRFWHVCYQGNSASLSRQTPCPQPVTERGPGNTQSHTTTQKCQRFPACCLAQKAPPFWMTLCGE